MSHYACVVLVPGDTPKDKIMTEVERLLAPFDENTCVEPYRVEQTDDDLKVAMEHYGVSGLEALAKHWRDWCGEECEIVDSTFYSLRTYNPKSKWDWWVVGGRWDGWLTQRDLPRGHALGNGDQPTDANICKVRDLPPPKLITEARGLEALLASRAGTPLPPLPPEEQYYDTPYACITPDGEWHAQGRMGWFGMSDDDESNRQWGARYFEILSGHRDCWAVCCDLHI